MNVHHLELFYYVARHGGIMEAVRNIPYGIQQPAVSGQVAQLEEYLGVKLFQRRPFALTAAGEKLYAFIQPFFANLDTMAVELQGGQARQIRLGASAAVLLDHLPDLLRSVRKKFPGLKITLREGFQSELETLLQKEEIDLAVTAIEKKAAPDVRSMPLIELPLVLLVEKGSNITDPKQLWESDKIEHPLICLPAAEAASKHFQQHLAKIGVDWFPSIEASSLSLIDPYVAGGLGIGVSVAIPGGSFSPKVRVLPLPECPPVVVGILWRGKASPLVQLFLDEAQVRARKLRSNPSRK
jgi:DNA-binding transcriptional LysR family regulator